MKSDTIYESHISTVRWLVYDVPGNVGWILYLVCLIQCFVKRPEFMEIPLVLISLLVGILPAIAMVVGMAELISEQILKLDRILPKKRLYRGFGALTWGTSEAFLRSEQRRTAPQRRSLLLYRYE